MDTAPIAILNAASEPLAALATFGTPFAPLFQRAPSRASLDRYLTGPLTDLLLDYKNVNVPTSHAARTIVRDVSGQTGIPTMVDGDVVIADDDDKIIAYLNEKYGKR